MHMTYMRWSGRLVVVHVAAEFNGQAEEVRWCWVGVVASTRGEASLHCDRPSACVEQ